jgi:hypothetical protein
MLARMDVLSLYAAADQLDDVAALLQARAGHLATGAAHTRWHSPAARAYYARIEAVTADLRACAARLGALADSVRRHAARILVDAAP